MSRIALLYGGGGHVKAAGCTIKGNAKAGLESLLRELESELEKV